MGHAAPKISGRNFTALIRPPLDFARRKASAGLHALCPPAICRRYAKVVPAS